MKAIKDTELILTPENKVYHLNLSIDDIADNIIIVGDQSRVKQISKHFSRIDCVIKNREFVTHTGEYNGKRISVLSTGIGTDNIDIVMNELDAAKNIDFILLNHGGIRSMISKGDITVRTAYKVMPFENSVVVCELEGRHVYELINYLILNKKAHPISGINIVLDKNYNLLDAKINGKSIDKNKIYSVATSDYLLNGGDKMIFFEKSKKNIILDYKIRNILIDYFKEVDTVSFKIDNRFILKK